MSLSTVDLQYDRDNWVVLPHFLDQFIFVCSNERGAARHAEKLGTYEGAMIWY